MKNHSIMVSQKENGSFPATKPKDMDYYDLYKEFERAVMKKSSKLKKIQKGSSMISEIKTNRQRSTLLETKILNKK